jgi:hypothetical protein
MSSIKPQAVPQLETTTTNWPSTIAIHVEFQSTPHTLSQITHESFNATHALTFNDAPADVRYDAPSDHGRPHKDDDHDDDDGDGDSGGSSSPMPGNSHSVTFSPPVVFNANGPDSVAIEGGKYDIVAVDEDQSLR